MAALIYFLCGLTCLISAVLLLRSYLHSRSHLLLYSGLCFSGLTLSNLLLVIDRFVLGEDVSLLALRLATAFVSLLLLLFGLIWEHD